MNVSWKRTLYIMFFARFVTAVGFSVIFPFLPLYVDELGSSTSLSTELLAGLAFSAQAFTMMLASPIWGGLADRFGRKVMVERAMLGGAVVFCLMGFARTAEELVILRAMQGMITGVASASNALVAAEAPRERTGYVMGLMQLGVWAGVSAGPLLGGVIADTWNFQAAFMVTAFLLGIAGVLVWFFVDENFEPTVQSRQSPFFVQWRRIIVFPGVGITYGLRFTSWLGRMMLPPILSLFVFELMPDSEKVATMTGIMVGAASVAGTASAVYLGRLGDRIGHRRVFIWSALVAALGYFPQMLVQTVWQLIVLQLVTGAAIGGVVPTLSALLARYTLPGDEGTVYGLENSIIAASRTVAPLLGASLAVWFGLRSTFAVAALLFLLTSVVAAYYLPEATLPIQRSQETG